MSKELKVGLLAIVSLAILILGFNFLKGKDIFDRTTKIYAIFTKLSPLERANAVKINGVSIGTVYDIQPTDKNISGVKVTISLSEDINIPANSVAYVSSGIVGASAIVIEKGNSGTMLKDGDVIQTRQDAGLFGDISSELPPTLLKVRESLDSVKSLIGNFNKAFDPATQSNLQATIAGLNRAAQALNIMLDPQNGALSGSLQNVNAITANMRKNNDSITLILGNTNRFTKKLSDLEIQRTIDSLDLAVSSMKKTIDKISSSEGSLGALINDRKLYNKLNDVALSAEILLDDLRAHPKRYVNISVFGKKDKDGALNSPSVKDTLPK